MAIGGKTINIALSEGASDLLLDMFVSSPNPKHPEKVLIKNALVDTGSDFTLLPEENVKKLKLVYIGTKTITGVHNDSKDVKFYSAKINIDPVIDSVFEVGVSDDFTPIIGMNLIIKWHTLINGPFKTFEIVSEENYTLK